MLQPMIQQSMLERSFRELSGNVWVVASIVYRFRDKRQKYQHRRLNSYRGDYTTKELSLRCWYFWRLLSRMTLEEKVAQIQGVWENPAFMKTPESRFVDDKGAFLPDHAAVLLKDGIGQMSRPSEVTHGPREEAEFT